MQYVFDLVYDAAMVGIRESVRKLVNAWWNKATPQQRYTQPCAVSLSDVLRDAGVSLLDNRLQARRLIAERVYQLRLNSVQDANKLE